MIGDALLGRAWARILRQHISAGWLYAWVVGESFLMRPEATIRAVWAVGRRGGSALGNLLRLGSLQVVWLIAFAVLLALALRVLNKTHGYAFGELIEIVPWTYAPKLLVTLVFAAGWLGGVVPARAMSLDLADAWSLAYHALSLIAVGASVVALLRADPSLMPEAPRFLALPWALGAATLALAFGFAWRSQQMPERFRPVGRGDRLGELSFLPLTADAVTIRFPSPQPVLIDFWASWCAPCVESLPQWQALASTVTNATLISANVETDNTAFVKAFVAERGLRFAVSLAPDALQAKLQVDTLPTTLLLGKNGEVRAYWVGAMREGELRTAIEAAQ